MVLSALTGAGGLSSPWSWKSGNDMYHLVFYNEYLKKERRILGRTKEEARKRSDRIRNGDDTETEGEEKGLRKYRITARQFNRVAARLHMPDQQRRAFRRSGMQGAGPSSRWRRSNATSPGPQSYQQTGQLRKTAR